MGGVLPKPVTTKVLERRGNDLFRVGLCSMNGYREHMEDAHIIHFEPKDRSHGSSSWAMFGVFDGHVTDKCSAFASQELLRALQQWKASQTTSTPDGLPPDDVIQNLALEVDRKWLDRGEEGGSAGIWVLASLVDDENYHLQIGNVGDSRVLVSRTNGTMELLTKDHKPENPEERSRIESCGGYVENNRVDGSLALSRAFGDSTYKQHVPTTDQNMQKVIARCEVTRTVIKKGSDDFLMLFCDGVYEGEFDNDQIAHVASKHLESMNDLAEVCSVVSDEALYRGSRDNISCMLVKFEDGSTYTTQYPCDETLPGAFSSPESKAFVTAYQNMLGFGKTTLTLPQALRYRYDYIREMIPKLIQKYATDPVETLSFHDFCAILQPPITQRQSLLECSQETLTEKIQQQREKVQISSMEFLQNMHEELESFGNGPETDSDLSTQLQWFEDWANQRISASTETQTGGLSDSTIQQMLAAQQHLGVPLHSLLNLISPENRKLDEDEDDKSPT